RHDGPARHFGAGRGPRVSRRNPAAPPPANTRPSSGGMNGAGRRQGSPLPPAGGETGFSSSPATSISQPSVAPRPPSARRLQAILHTYTEREIARPSEEIS